MLSQERQAWIRQQLHTEGAVTVTKIMDSLQVSAETVRRDLLAMEQQGLLRRVHGGAVMPGGMKPFYDLNRRNQDHGDSKAELCRLAVNLLQEGDYIGIDAGSTATFFAEALKSCPHRLTVVTHSADVFEALKNLPQFCLILCGGMYNPTENAFYGSLCMDTLDKLHMTKSFLFPSAVSLEGGICDYQQEFLQIQKKYLEHSASVYILADSSKFEKKALLKMADMTNKFTYVTDSGLPLSLKNLYQENGFTILTEELPCASTVAALTEVPAEEKGKGLL